MRLLPLLVSALAVTAPPPADPVVTTGPSGAYAAAVPGFSGSPAIAGDSVAFTVEDRARDRLFAIRAASVDGRWRTLYTAPTKRPGYGATLAASSARVVAVRFSNRVQTCVVGGECTPAHGVIVAGPASGRLERVAHATERLPATASCRRRIAQMDEPVVSVSGSRIAYARRTRCLSPRRRGHSQVVVRSLRTGAVRVVHRGRAVGVQLAGPYVAFQPDRRGGFGTAVVIDTRSRRVVYRARGDWYSLGADGTLAVARIGASFMGRLAWYSAEHPRRHRLPNRVSMFSAAPLIYAGGQIAYVSEYDDNGAELSVTDLRGDRQVHARFERPEQLDAFAFDGSRLAFAYTRYRADQGHSDDGLHAICVGDDVLVQAAATVVEVHSIADRTRMAPQQLPSAAPYRSPAAERPECPPRD